ncbi:MAG: hypothetical protein Q8P16_00240 [bacterium]|nr:hypothetical protein [bacterium]
MPDKIKNIEDPHASKLEEASHFINTASSIWSGKVESILLEMEKEGEIDTFIPAKDIQGVYPELAEAIEGPVLAYAHAVLTLVDYAVVSKNIKTEPPSVSFVDQFEKGKDGDVVIDSALASALNMKVTGPEDLSNVLHTVARSVQNESLAIAKRELHDARVSESEISEIIEYVRQAILEHSKNFVYTPREQPPDISEFLPRTDDK